MNNVIEIKNLKKYFTLPVGNLHAVDDVSFRIQQGKTMGVVGESGCGKSTLGRTVIHLLESTGGSLFFEGNDVTKLSKRQLDRYRHEVGIIFQDPYSSLNPRKTAEQTISEALKVTGRYKRNQIREEAVKILDMVGIDSRLIKAYPHELDGGRRQRVGIGRALAINPKFIVCDEPVSALDVSIQAQVLNLLKDLQEKMNLTYMFITHNMSVVRFISDDICVMYLGQLVETSPAKELFTNTLHPYTMALISAIPSTDVLNQKEQVLMKGELASPINPESGCRFAPRCEYACEACKKPQILEEIFPNHLVACCRARELNDL